MFNEEIILRYTVQEEDTQYFTQVHCSHYMVMGCNIIQEVKGLTKKLCFVLLSRRMTTFYAKLFTLFTCFYMVVACIISMVRTTSKTGSKRVNDKLQNYALPRKKTGLLANI